MSITKQALVKCSRCGKEHGISIYKSINVAEDAAMKRQVVLGEMDIDCYGDRAEQTEFTSTMFADAPTMEERPELKKPSAIRKAKLAAEDVLAGNTERGVLTDRDEKFEYEFGVIEEDEDDGEYEYEDDDTADDGDGAKK